MRTRFARLGAVLAAVIALIAAPAVTAAPAQAADQWNPPANLVQPLGEVWNHVESTYPDLYGFRNYGWDQVMANKGSVNYCVRWESDAPVSAALRDRIHADLKKQFGKWMAAMVESNGTGHNAWPYTNVPVNIVGWAVKDRSTLQWSDNSVDIYSGVLDSEGAPQCLPTGASGSGRSTSPRPWGRRTSTSICMKSATPSGSTTSTTGPRPASAASS